MAEYQDNCEEEYQEPTVLPASSGMAEYQNDCYEEYQEARVLPASSGTQIEEFHMEEFQKKPIKQFRETRHFCFYAVILLHLIVISVLLSGFYFILKSQKEDVQKFFKDLNGDNDVIRTDLNKTVDAILKNKEEVQKFFEDLNGDNDAIRTDLNKTVDAILKNKEDLQKFFKDLKGDNDAIRADVNKTLDAILKNKDTVKDISKQLKDLEASFQDIQKNYTHLLDIISRKQGSTCAQKEYFMSTDYVTFSEAFNNCEEKNMSLVSIENVQEYNALNGYFNSVTKYGNYFWSSGQRTDEASKFYWKSSGKSLSYTKWWPGYPYVNHNYHCLLIQLYTDTNLHMHNYDCNYKNRYVCECKQ